MGSFVLSRDVIEHLNIIKVLNHSQTCMYTPKLGYAWLMSQLRWVHSQTCMYTPKLGYAWLMSQNGWEDPV